MHSFPDLFEVLLSSSPEHAVAVLFFVVVFPSFFVAVSACSFVYIFLSYFLFIFYCWQNLQCHTLHKTGQGESEGGN